MIEFAHSYYFYGFLGLILLAVLSLVSYQRRRRRLQGFVPSKAMRDLVMPERIGRKRLTRDSLFLLGLSALLFALARPQMISKMNKEDAEQGIELMLCLDVSNSMLSTDIPPSRISFLKRVVSRLMAERPHDRIGVVIFAANAYVQLPITSDLRSAQDFLADVSPQMLSAQGTNIGEAIGLARASFSKRKDIGRAIVVFTDAEDHEEGASEAATEASREDVRVHVVGIGTLEGGTIPTDEGYLKDEDGQIVTTRLNPEVAQAVAQAGKGSYISSPHEADILKELNTNLERLPKARLGKTDYMGYEEYFRIPLLLALVLLVGEVFISQRRNRLWRRYNIFSNDKK